MVDRRLNVALRKRDLDNMIDGYIDDLKSAE
jgi:hypothetical protein